MQPHDSVGPAWLGASLVGCVFVVVGVAVPASASPSAREVVDLDDGTRVEGWLLEYIDRDHVTLEVDGGESRRLDWIHIRSMKEVTGSGQSATSPSSTSSRQDDVATTGTISPIDNEWRAHRMALTAIGGYEPGSHLANDAALGGSLQYFLSDTLAVGVGARWFGDRSSALSSPTHEDSWTTDLDFIETVVRGADDDHFGLPDVYLTAGIGMVSTKPVALVDTSRTFNDKLAFAPNLGIGTRVFVGRALAFSIEMRDTMFVADVENPKVSDSNPSNWLGTPSFVNDIEFDFGLTLWLPMR